MIGPLKRLFPSPAPPAELVQGPMPDRQTCVIGDIHGRADLLAQMLEALADDGLDQATDWVFVGDYIDRGPQSAQVLEILHELQTRQPDRITCLLGNHERMMLDFLDDPMRNADLWLRNGGLETLASFSIGRVHAASEKARKQALAEALRAALTPPVEAWLRALPVIWRSGSLAVVHANADPLRGLDEQQERTLLWGRPRPEQPPRADGIWVAHGHTIVPAPTAQYGRIAVDTGAVAGGGLTAAVCAAGKVRFMTIGKETNQG